MTEHGLNIALIHETFHDPVGRDRLAGRLVQAREAGAELAVLPELPLDAWAPAGPGYLPVRAELDARGWAGVPG